MNASTSQRRPLVALVILSVCLLLLGINGFWGGYMMLADPTGSPLGMPAGALERTPFENYVLPGLWLILIWGCVSMIALFGLWLRPRRSKLDLLASITHEHWAWDLVVLLGLALLVWLTVQVVLLPAVAPVQFILYGLAALLVVVPLLPNVRGYYRVAAV